MISQDRQRALRMIASELKSRGMKAPFSPIFPILFCLPLVLAASACAFDEPLYDRVSFSADGIFMEEQEKDNLLQALVAIASNFSGQSKVDEDLKEKALAVALTLSPLHYQARNTHRNLMRGVLPEPTPYFKTLSSISELLWNNASRMLNAPSEPEERKLAALLLDISIILHPDPSDERITKLAASTQGKPVPWEDFLMLQPDTSRSSSRSRSPRPRPINRNPINPSRISHPNLHPPPSLHSLRFRARCQRW